MPPVGQRHRCSVSTLYAIQSASPVLKCRKRTSISPCPRSKTDGKNSSTILDWSSGKKNDAYGYLASHLDVVETNHLQAGAIDEERNAFQIAHPDEVGAGLDKRDEASRGRLRLRLRSVMSRTIFDAPTTRPEASLDRRDRKGHKDTTAVRANALGLKVIDPLAVFQAGENVVFLGDAVRWDDERDMATDSILGGEAEQTFGRSVPALNDAVE